MRDEDVVVNQDIDSVLRNWEFKPGMVQARLIRAKDGRELIQMRIEMGVLQLETSGRPDGTRPHGQRTYFDYLQHHAQQVRKRGEEFQLSEEECAEADREFMQFYHRRISWLALREYVRALQDADHTLAFMDFVAHHSPSEEYTRAHEQYRGFVLFQRTQAAAALQVEKNHPEQAIDELRKGLEQMREFFAEYGVEDQMEQDEMVQHLRRVESTLREQYHIKATLTEQLEEAVLREDYERAAQLRDALKRR